MSNSVSRGTGGISDLFKHAALVALLRNLISEKAKTHSKDFTFGYMDTHCGTGVNPVWVKEGSELESLMFSSPEPKGGRLFHSILASTVEGSYYPSSWLLADKVMKQMGVSDKRLTLFDTSATITKQVLAEIANEPSMEFFCKDAFKHYKDKSLYRTDFVFIDPSYRSANGKPSKDWVEVEKMGRHLLGKGIPFMIVAPIDEKKSYLKLADTLDLHTMTYSSDRKQNDGQALLFGGVSLKDFVSVELDVVETLQAFNNEFMTICPSEQKLLTL